MILIIIDKRDVLNILFDFQKLYPEDNEVTVQLNRLIRMKEPDLDAIKFVNDRREFELRQFYEKMRKSYNNKNSKLYRNLVRFEELEPREILTCLGSLQLQILLFYKTLGSDTNFLAHARFDSICDCLKHFYNTGDYAPAMKLLSLIKSDLKIFEAISE